MTPTRFTSPRRAWFGILILLVAAGALCFRLPRLAERPFHTDESVQAAKTGVLLDTGVYRYDPQEFHGPTLYYLTLPLIRLSGARSFAQTTEIPFRLVSVIFGVGLILLLGLAGDGLGRPAAVCAGILTALSPAMVFYSRYYIQEISIVFFTFGLIVLGWRYSQTRAWGWALGAGFFAGIMHATKETSVVIFGAMIAGLVLTSLWARWRDGVEKGGLRASMRSAVKGRHLAGALIVGALVSVLFFSSFLTNPRGPLDSILTYRAYLLRAGGAGMHDHPWYYYLKMLIYTRNSAGPWWSEGLIVLLAIVGISSVLLRRRVAGASLFFLRFLAFYTIVMTALFSVIPYKTPWNMLGFLHGMILMAGVGAVAVVEFSKRFPIRAGACIVLALLSVQLAGQAYRANFKFYADPRNPYVYAHTSMDALHLVARVNDVAQFSPAGKKMVIKVFAPESDYWPLPWYLRQYSHVGYWHELSGDPNAEVIVAAPEFQPALDPQLHDRYHTEFYGLRPGVLMLAYIRNDLWDAFIEQQIQQTTHKPAGPSSPSNSPRSR